MLWEISGNGLKSPSYIFGTIHALCPDEFNVPQAVEKKLKQTEQLSLEVDMDAPNFMAELMQSATLPEGKTLSTLLKAEDYKLLATHLATTLQLDLKMFDNMKPFMLQSLLLSQLTDCKAVSYEQRLMELAHAQGKEVIGVETVREQLAAMDKLPQELQTDMLVKTVKDIPAARASYLEMVELYLAQDLDGLARITKEDLSEEEYKLYEDAFLIARNLRWIPAMEREARAKSTFFAVGAGHLTGPKGVLELLRQRGYILKPVMN
ncbi:TraB/GumN family protein [Pontibacter cellulosilyticus]|uniref:TraB/GumN family protein n=1 Tax=Pontibacter cellulosilyticus TaxID=1720253 RepID=A0A923N6T4_9BACT|nr:TraB/GumN family protein [Pontibacter cellulosilyticus]MBC5992849.1 TraB/GumN family protein [Pontibacter cellulosilyticus]